jgi:hypothetical protein
MPRSTTANRRKWNRRQVVAYHRDSPTGDDGASIEIQKEPPQPNCQSGSFALPNLDVTASVNATSSGSSEGSRVNNG